LGEMDTGCDRLLSL